MAAKEILNGHLNYCKLILETKWAQSGFTRPFHTQHMDKMDIDPAGWWFMDPFRCIDKIYVVLKMLRSISECGKLVMSMSLYI